MMIAADGAGTRFDDEKGNSGWTAAAALRTSRAGTFTPPPASNTCSRSRAPNVELTNALKHLTMSRFSVHQRAGGFVIPGMAALFDGARIIIEELNVEDKALQYSSDLPGAAA